MISWVVQFDPGADSLCRMHCRCIAGRVPHGVVVKGHGWPVDTCSRRYRRVEEPLHRPNAIDAFGAEPDMMQDIEQEAAAGVKRVVRPPGGEIDWAGAQSPYAIAAFTEIKTVWHPKGL